MTRTSALGGFGVVSTLLLTGCAFAPPGQGGVATVTVTASPADSTGPSQVPSPTALNGNATPAAPAADATGADRPAPAADAPAFTAERDHLDVADLHAQGIDHQVGDYRLQMDSFAPDATAEVMRDNPFNPEPKEGAYAIAQWTVTYTGTTEGNPWIDITTAVMGADGNQYPSHQCLAVVKDGLMTEIRTLNPGGVYQFAVCYDAPAAALQGATAVRAGTMQRTDRVDWSTRPAA